MTADLSPAWHPPMPPTAVVEEPLGQSDPALTPSRWLLVASGLCGAGFDGPSHEFADLNKQDCLAMCATSRNCTAVSWGATETSHGACRMNGLLPIVERPSAMAVKPALSRSQPGSPWPRQAQGLCFIRRNAVEVPVVPCGQCEAIGYDADTCKCGFCSSFGLCTFTCGHAHASNLDFMAIGPRCVNSTSQFESGTPSTRINETASASIPFPQPATGGLQLPSGIIALLLSAGLCALFHRLSRGVFGRKVAMGGFADMPLRDLDRGIDPLL